MARSIDPIPPLSPRSRWEAPLRPPEPERDTGQRKQRGRDAQRRVAPPTATGGARADGDELVADEAGAEHRPPVRHVDVRA